MNAVRTVRLTPPAASFVQSTTDIGYTIESALADIIDNSLTARASHIQIIADHSPRFRVGIVDNGTGMSQSELLEAMRYASKDPRTPRDSSDLGRFGLGLKFASLSQCRKLTVISKYCDEINAATWDRAHIDHVNDWEVLIPSEPDTLPFVDMLSDSGTIVLWEDMSFASQYPSNDLAQSEFNRQFTSAKRHLELIFHRFLELEEGNQQCRISLNGVPLIPFDPFNRSNGATQKTEPESIGDNVSFQIFTLPHRKLCKSESEWKLYAGEDGYLKNQGLYIYRERRLIIYGTWLRLMQQTEMNKLTRVKMDISNNSDVEFGITLDKSKAKLPQAVRERLNKVLGQMGSSSRRIFAGRGRRVVADNLAPAWERVRVGTEIIYRVNNENPVVSDYLASIPKERKSETLHFLNFVGASLPMDALYADLGADSNNLGQGLTSEQLGDAAQRYFEYFTDERGFSVEMALSLMATIPPMAENWEEIEELLDIEGMADG